MHFDLDHLPEAAAAMPPAWAVAGMLLFAVAILVLLLRLTRRRPHPVRSGEAARQRLGLTDVPHS